MPIDKTLLPKEVEVPEQDLRGLPPSVIALILLLLKTIEELTAKLKRNSSNSNRPPSTDNPLSRKKREPKPEAAPKGKPGAKKGHKGYRQPLLAPTETRHILPGPCPCGGTPVDTQPYYTHQHIELPEIALPVTHFVLHKGPCPDCGKICKGHLPYEFRFGFGPRFTALVAEVAGVAGNSRDTVRSFCSSVLGLGR